MIDSIYNESEVFLGAVDAQRTPITHVVRAHSKFFDDGVNVIFINRDDPARRDCAHRAYVDVFGVVRVIPLIAYGVVVEPITDADIEAFGLSGYDVVLAEPGQVTE